MRFYKIKYETGAETMTCHRTLSGALRELRSVRATQRRGGDQQGTWLVAYKADGCRVDGVAFTDSERHDIEAWEAHA